MTHCPSLLTAEASMSPQPATKRTSTVNSNSKWESTFPADIQTEKNSATFVHRFISITSAFILDKRGILGEKHFKTRTIEKLQIPVFERENSVSVRLIKKIDALKQAVVSKYLREFAIVLYQKPDEEDVKEVFSFRLMYGEEDQISISVDTGINTDVFSQSLASATFSDLGTTRQYFVDTIIKLHRCIKHLETLPAETDASFRISFTEHAPKDYMPEGFDESDKFYEIAPEMTRDQFGILCGNHHKLQLLAASQFWKPGDFGNTTFNSLNQSIVDAPTLKTKQTKGVEKKSERVGRRFPYGQTATMNKGNRKTPEPE
ncbi:hypothetical protein B9Z55_002069 [Caenorhabditis nigoni]|uniref:HORMA domain-containing protein n=2 Tax=Caenorhabditis nigoni TaxID=1611254 RepID=A0A2G5VIP6_9PELO|nr:hypothetical protein B9Z55_002069 [Caenorhabditis nigoni]